MRNAFCYILIFNQFVNGGELWAEFRQHMSEDFRRQGMNEKEAMKKALV